MASGIAHIALILAAADVDQSELRAWERWVEKNGAKRFSQLVEALRRQAEGSSLFPTVSEQASSGSRQFDDTTVRVERLLVDEAGLSKSLAASELRAGLVSDGVSDERLPRFNRGSFSRWLERVIEITSPSLVLHIATRLRNERVPQSSNWPLKAGGSDQT